MDIKLGKKPGRCAQQLDDINAASTEVAQDPVDTPQLTTQPAKKQKSTKKCDKCTKTDRSNLEFIGEHRMPMWTLPYILHTLMASVKRPLL